MNRDLSHTQDGQPADADDGLLLWSEEPEPHAFRNAGLQVRSAAAADHELGEGFIGSEMAALLRGDEQLSQAALEEMRRRSDTILREAGALAEEP
jgi:hypothetical protein